MGLIEPNSIAIDNTNASVVGMHQPSPKSSTRGSVAAVALSMNKALLDPFTLSQECPDTLSSKYNWGPVVVFKFCPSGHYAAVGLLSGEILIVETDSWSTIFELEGHSGCIIGLAWSCDGRRLVSAARDMHVFVWDMLTHQRVHKKFMGCVISQVAIGESGFVVNKAEGSPIFVDDHKVHELPIKKSVASAFLEDGSLLVGDSMGNLSVFRYISGALELKYTQKVCSSSISEIYVKGSDLFLISKDRVIRNIKIQDAEPRFEVVAKISDAVNRSQWFGAVASPSAEFILAVPMEHPHSIYTWGATDGSIEHIFECPEEVLTLDFHPSKALLVATGVDTGAAYVWSVKYKQQWGALAPDFVELVVNEYYQEREDEFDILSETPDDIKKWPKDRVIDVQSSEVVITQSVLHRI